MYDWSGERLETFILNETAIEHLHRYAMALPLVEGRRVLDVACGEGYGTALLAGRAADVTGVDVDAETVKKAKEKYRLKNLSFLTGDVRNLSLPDASFDAVVSFETLEHIAEHERMLRELKRVLKPDGLLLVSTPDKKFHSDLNAVKSNYHVKELYRQEFADLMAGHFRHVRYFFQRSFFASVIVPEQGPGDGLEFYTGGFEGVHRRPGLDPFFIIAVASDAPLPATVSASLFNGAAVFEAAVKRRQEAVQASLTYKTGKLILRPFKFFKTLFSR